MAHGTLANLSTSAFVRTPPPFARRIIEHLLAFPQEPVNVLDPTAGEGDLLAPCLVFPAARLFGVEISAERAEEAQRRLPTATILSSAFEGVSCPPGSMSLVLTNPPYFLSDGKRAEYRIIAEAGNLLMPGGIMVAIIPARSAWDGTMINHWCKWYEQIRVWKFPDRASAEEEGGFEDYTQICVLGVRLATPAKPDAVLKKRLAGLRWRAAEKAGQSPWQQGFPPPALPDEPNPAPYAVPAALVQPALVVRHADDGTLLSALARSGAHFTAGWQAATTWPEEGFVDAPAMPPTGEAHLAADILTGLLDGEIVQGPDGTPHLFTSFVTQEWVSIDIDDEEREKQRERGVVNLEVRQQQDKPILGVLNLLTGHIHYCQGEEVFSYLFPWLPTLAARVLEKRQPLYQLDPQDWEMRVVAQIGLDKQLPGAAFPGLAVAQQHRVYAMGRAIDVKGRTAIQGEPGTGKSRMGIATAARQAYRWRARTSPEFRHTPQPAWVKQLRRAWLANPATRNMLGVEPVRDQQSGQVIAYRHLRTQKLLPPEAAGPAALPVLVTTPKKVTKEWANEIRAAWPQAEVLFIKDQQDVVNWMQRCALSPAPAVFGIFSHSTSRAFGRAWQPVVLEKSETSRVPDLEPDASLQDQLEAIHGKGGRVVAYQFKDSGQVLTKEVSISYYYCPDCKGRIEATPRGMQRPEKPANPAPASGASTDEDAPGQQEIAGADSEALEPVTSLTWFKSRPRWCQCEVETHRLEGESRVCNAPLWADARVEATARKYPQLPFAGWSQAVEAMLAQRAMHSGVTGTAQAADGQGQSQKGARTAGRMARGIRLVAAETGPFAVAEPELTVAEGYEPVVDEEGSLLAYRHATSGEWLLPLYHLRSRRLLGYVSSESGELLKRTRRFDLRMPPPDSFSPFEYLHRFYRGCVALAIIDESHNGRGRSTDIAHSLHQAQCASQACMYASGTHYGGNLDDFYHYWLRFNPQFWLRLGLGWNDTEKAISRYGVIQQWTREYESDARRGSGRSDVQVSTIPAPGISARIIPRLLEDLCYLTVLDVGAHMPPRIEIPEVVSMHDHELEQAQRKAERERRQAEQELIELRKARQKLLLLREGTMRSAELERLRHQEEEREERLARAQREEAEVKEWVMPRNLAYHYGQIVRRLEDLARDRNNAARLAKGTIPRWFAALPCESAFEVTQTERDDWGDVIGRQLLLRTPVLAEDYLYPLEKRLLAIVRQELAEGRRLMVYFEQNDIRSMARRLQWVLREFAPWTLPNNVEAEDRQQCILSAVEQGHRVVIVPYRRVNEGLNLQRGIDTVIWYEMAMNLFMQEEVRIYYMVYAGTAGHYKLRKLGSQSGAAAAFAGEPARGALIEHAGADKTTLARLSSSLEMLEGDVHAGQEQEQEQEESEALKAAFARRGEELQQALKKGRQWIGVVDTLPQRLAAFHAARTSAGSGSDMTMAVTGNGRVVDADAEERTALPVPVPLAMRTGEPVADRRGDGVLHAPDALPVSESSSAGTTLFPAALPTTKGNGLHPNGQTGAGANGQQDGVRPGWEALREREKAAKASKRQQGFARRKQKGGAATTTTNLLELMLKGGEEGTKTIPEIRTEEKTTDTTSVSQASLW